MAAARSLWLLGLARAAAVARRGLAGRGVAGPGPDGREPDPDSDWEPEERELQEVASALKRQKAAIRFQKVRRQVQPRGAPPRTLSREAMEQIRFLHKEFAETWSIPRLAEGFGVSVEVIRRVLKSKFDPMLNQKLKDQREDQKAMKKPLGHSPQVSGENLKPHSVRHLVAGSRLLPRVEAPFREQDHRGTLKVMKPPAGSSKSCVPARATSTGHQRSLRKHPSSVFQAPSWGEGDGSAK